MNRTIDTPRPYAAWAGDRLTVSRPDGSTPRRGEILEVLGGPGHAHYRVRWDEEHESFFHPEAGVTIERNHAERPQEDRR